MNLKTIFRSGVAAAVLFGSLAASASVLQTWNLTNKSPGALGADYGLRLNQMPSVGVVGSSTKMIFDFEAAGHGMQMQLIDNAGDLEMHVSGNAYGALHDGGTGYSSEFAGTYDIDFIWKNVDANALGGGNIFDYLAENGIGNDAMGAGTGTVQGVTAGTAFGSGLDLFDWSGAYDWTLDIDSTNNPDASGWLTFGSVNGDPARHNGDFGFSMVAVPTPGTIALLGLGLILVGLRRARR